MTKNIKSQKDKDKSKDKDKNENKDEKFKKQKGGGIIDGITNLINAFKGLGSSINNEISLAMNIQKDLSSGTQPAPGAPPN